MAKPGFSYDDKTGTIRFTFQWAIERGPDGTYIREYHEQGYTRYGPVCPLKAAPLVEERKKEVSRKLRSARPAFT